MKLLFLLASFAVFSSFSTTQVSPQHKFFSQQSQVVMFKKILVTFNFTHGGCAYHLEAVIETTNGSGVGELTQTCGGGKPRFIIFDIYGANFTRISASDLSNFRTEEGPYIPSPEEISEIVDGYNENVPLD